jgi:NTE family protein
MIAMTAASGQRRHSPLDAALDIFRIRQDITGWTSRPLSMVSAASQVRTCQHAELAREHLARLCRTAQTLLVEPVPYWKVAGTGFYEQFLDSREWPQFMRAGREAMVAALRSASLTGRGLPAAVDRGPVGRRIA